MLVFSIVIIAVLLSGVAGYFARSGETITTTATVTTIKTTSEIGAEISTTTEMSTTIKTVEPTIATSQTANFSLSTLPIGTRVSMNSDSSIDVFVRYFFYNANKTATISPTNDSLLFIWGGKYFANISATNPNFTIREISPIIPVTIGGAYNESEGTVIAYEIHSSPNSNGSYALDVSQLFPEGCSTEFPLVVGNGSPDYLSQMIGGCIVWTANDPSDVQNQLLAQVVAVDN